MGSIPSQDLLQKTASIPSLAAFCHRTQVVHPVKTLRRLKWYILPHLIARFCRERAENPLRTLRMNPKRKTASIPSLAAFCHRTQVVHPVKTLRRLKWYILSKRFGNGSEISLRSCRDSAENVPRTLQEPAENPPYEPQTKLPFTVRLLRKDFVRRQTLRQNRLE